MCWTAQMVNMKLADAPHLVNIVQCWLVSKTSDGRFEHCKNTDDFRTTDYRHSRNPHS